MNLAPSIDNIDAPAPDRPRLPNLQDYLRILLRHILPNAVAPVLVYATITVGVLIAAEATLTYLGVGLQQPAISWGLQISAGQRQLRDAPHLVLFPSLALTLTVMSFIMLGDALRDALDPRQRGR